MTILRKAALAWLLLIFVLGLCADWVVSSGYAQQFREHANAPPSHRFPLGTDELGRDRLARLLHGTRVSLLLAPAAAMAATTIALVLGVSAGYFGGGFAAAILSCTDLVASVPWLFLLLAVRAFLPLDVGPAVSVGITFALLGLFGWASGVRLINACVARAKDSDYVLQCRAAGCSNHRLLFVHIASSLRPVLAAQFWLFIPHFLMAEANLGVLGLGVTEPLPSWGNLIAEIQNVPAVLNAPWRLAPALLLILMLGGFQIVFADKEIGR